MSVDWRVDLDDAWERIGFERGIQGNLDPTLLLTSWDVVEQGMRDVLRRAANRPGHIFNLGHGVLAPTDPDMLRRLVDAVHEETTRRADLSRPPPIYRLMSHLPINRRWAR